MESNVEVRQAYQELLTPRLLGLALSIMAVLTALFTLWDPMDLAQTLSGIERLGFSVFVGSSDLVICYACGVLVLYLTRLRSKHQTLVSLVATALIMAAPCAAIMYAGYTLFHGGRPPDDGILELYAVNAINLGWTTVLIFYVLFCRLGRQSPLALLERTAPEKNLPDKQHAPPGSEETTIGAGPPVPGRMSRVGDAATEPLPGKKITATLDDEIRSAGARQRGADARCANALDGRAPRERVHIRPVEPKRLLESLPESVGHDVVYIHVSGHYLEVVTTLGSAVVLMRLADAVATLSDHGMQIHRSYWAAYCHVRDLIRRDDRMLLCLSDGYELPVSRPFLRAVRDFTASLSDSTTREQVGQIE